MSKHTNKTKSCTMDPYSLLQLNCDLRVDVARLSNENTQLNNLVVEYDKSIRELKKQIAVAHKENATWKGRMERLSNENTHLDNIVVEYVKGIRELKKQIELDANGNATSSVWKDWKNRMEELRRADEDDEEEVVECDVFKLDGVEYLIDSDNTVYDRNTQDIIGKYDSVNQQICLA